MSHVKHLQNRLVLGSRRPFAGRGLVTATGGAGGHASSAQGGGASRRSAGPVAAAAAVDPAVRDMRVQYGAGKLEDGAVVGLAEPMGLFKQWLGDAVAAQVQLEPNNTHQH